MTILELKKLTVRFGGLTAVQEVDCAVEERRIFSVIGPNGAGKTTVFNAITGIYEPTGGTIEFRGRSLARPLSWQVLTVCALVGLAAGLVAAVLSVDVNALWRATVKRNFAGPDDSFSYRAALADGWNYLNGKLAIDPVRGGRWAVRTPDGRRTLGFADTPQEAEQMRVHFEQLIAASQMADRLQERDGRWAIITADDSEPLASFDTEADASAAVGKYAAIAREPVVRRRIALVSLLLGIAIGAAGSLAVWSRARRTPEVISRAGIARTFQNIRLFQNMTVVDNVLTAMDRSIQGGVVRMALQSPGIRWQEREARGALHALLRSVSLAGKETMLAKNLPYGDQRRLEIARALATEPQVILLDEPAAGMNPTESVELNGLIQQIRDRGLTVMLIEHHMKVVMGISDRIAVLDYGLKIAEGTPEEVRNDPRVIAAYLGSEEVT